MIAIPDLLSPDEVARVRGIIDAGEWVDGNVTSGAQSALAKRNEQLPEGSTAHAQAGALVLDALGRSPLFVAAALPLRVFPPLFNRYAGGQRFGTHVDNAVRIQRGSDFRGAFNHARMLLGEGRVDEARDWLDKAMATGTPAFREKAVAWLRANGHGDLAA